MRPQNSVQSKSWSGRNLRQRLVSGQACFFGWSLQCLRHSSKVRDINRLGRSQIVETSMVLFVSRTLGPLPQSANTRLRRIMKKTLAATAPKHSQGVRCGQCSIAWPANQPSNVKMFLLAFSVKILYIIITPKKQTDETRPLLNSPPWRR